MRVLVSGVGRSATTLLYQQVGQMMLEAFRTPRFRYEPYLWNINAGFAKGSRFGPEDYSALGMYAHKASPLFLSDPHPEHDVFMRSVFGSEPLEPGDPEAPDAWLVKVIRGSGRLEAYLKAYPDLKLIICLRNPVDTINSSMGMFSFTGEEFHASDAPRLLREVKANLPGLALPDAARASHLAISAVWWRAFTEWSMRVAAAYPARCHVVRHETLSRQQDEEIDRLVAFLGFSSADTFKVKLDEPAGAKIGAAHLLASDMGELYPHLRYYMDDCLREDLTPSERDAAIRDILERYAEKPFSPQLAADRLGRKSSVQLRGDLLSDRNVTLKYAPPLSGDPDRLPLRQMLEARAAASGTGLGAYKAYAPVRHSERTFGCCITSYNNKDTIRDAIFSALDQTRPFDRIVVVDDGSTDGSQGLLRDLEGRYSSLSVRYKAHNGGVSAARQTAIGLLDTDFVTQLDGDDCFWPTKNREEAEVVIDDPAAVAFSTILQDDGREPAALSDPGDYSGDAQRVFEKMLVRDGPIPRDVTVAAATFRAAGGYDFRLSLYEDWDLKLRLARMSGAWRKSGAHAGTVYNLRKPVLSVVENREHARALSYVFLKNVIGAPGLAGLAQRYEKASQFHRHQLTGLVQEMLARCDAGEVSREALKELIGRRAMSATLMEYEVDALSPGADVAALLWTAGVGFGRNEAPFAAIERPSLFWQELETATLNLKVRRPVAGVAVEVCNPLGPNQVTLELRAPWGMVFQGDFPVPPSTKTGAILQLQTLPIPEKLEAGSYEIRLTTKTFKDEVSKLRKGGPRRLYMIVTDVVGS